MRLANLAWSLIRSMVLGAVLAASISLPACAKSPPEAQTSGQAAAQPVAQPVAAGPDTTLPPGVDVSKLDDFQKKVFFRIINSEPSLCGQAQSLIVSAKKDCK